MARQILLALLTLALAAPAAASSQRPLVSVYSRGGMCVSAGGGGECGWTLTIDDRGIHVPGRAVRPVAAAELARLRAAIMRLRLADVVRRPFTSTCPTAWDGQERIYGFRGVPAALPACRYDLRRVEAVAIVDRLLGPA